MPNPGNYRGSRGDFLKAQREIYTQAVKDGNINDVVTDIQRRYFKRYPITLPHKEEPSQEWLDQVDDDAPDAEIAAPGVNGMSPEDASKALNEHTELMKELKDRKDVSCVLHSYLLFHISPFFSLLSVAYTTYTVESTTPNSPRNSAWVWTLYRR